MTWVYIQSESRLWTVGFYTPSGEWEPESDHDNPEGAAERVHWLNGGSMTAVELRTLLERVKKHGGPRLHEHISHDHLVGVLKRDLIERGCEYSVGWYGSRAKHISLIDTDEDSYERDGDSELEAVLKAWLAAAEAEGWEA